MAWLPKSRTARRRLYIVGAIAPVLIAAVALALFGMKGAISLFMLPSQARQETALVGRSVQLGGYVRPGTLVRGPGDGISFTVADDAKPEAAAVRVVYVGKDPLPDLFREGQGVVTKGNFVNPEQFEASQIMAKHDERYMPREVTKQLKASGEWRGDGETPVYEKAGAK
jgi:cytochrome c-type biogenesis protein CcmE